MERAGPGHGRRAHVSLVAVPDVMVGSLTGLYDVFRCFGALGWFDPALAAHPPFEVEIVTSTPDPVMTASGLPIPGQRSLAEVARTDIVIVPSTMVQGGEWRTGRHPEVVQWLRRMHDAGAMVCSACSGALLIAETGLLDGRDATVHWSYAETFRRNFPSVRLRLQETLVVAGDRDQLVMSGAASSWHDLALYLIARALGPAAAQAVAKFYVFQWHADGLAPYAVFEPRTDHGDAVVLHAQRWLADHLAADSPVEEMARRSGVPERSFKRRFRKATGHAPIAYVQRLRVERAKSRLETTEDPVEKIGWSVGYVDTSSFRRLFSRMVGMPPGAYRRRFRLPDFVRERITLPEDP
jgi:transcriptional regulator GlxA family with amidase domain